MKAVTSRQTNLHSFLITLVVVGDDDIKKDMKHWPFKVIERNGKPFITVKRKGLDRDFVSFFSNVPGYFLTLRQKISAMVLPPLDRRWCHRGLGDRVMDYLTKGYKKKTGTDVTNRTAWYSSNRSRV